MKKIIVLALIMGTLFITGCGKVTKDDVIGNLEKKVNKSDNYVLNGELEILNNEDSFVYDIDASYKKGDFYKVNLKNKSNNHEQIIIKNDDGVFVLTPSLNKTFKFQSEWPFNNSQAYLLQSLVKDLKNDKNVTIEFIEDGYVLNSKVNYPNNKELVKQNIYLDKNYNPVKVEVLTSEDKVGIKMTFNKIDYEQKLDNKYFAVNDNMNASTTTSDTETVSKLSDIIYPMYLPVGTTLKSTDTVTKTNGERIILTFEGDSSFMLVEETTSYAKEHEIIPVYGEVDFIAETVGSISETSASWTSGNVEYYIVSEDLDAAEMMKIARSLNAISVSK